MMILKEEEIVVWGRLFIKQVVVGQFISGWKAFQTKLDILQLHIIQQGGDKVSGQETLPGKEWSKKAVY